MTDLELLIYAARAIGKRIVGWNEQHRGEPVAVLDDGTFWQPLHTNAVTDCMGDALRLAVALGIGVDHASMRSWAWRCWGTPTVVAKEEFHNNGKDAANRRAIVRAAAEIGKHGTP
jgi:hypothetical protein